MAMWHSVTTARNAWPDAEQIGDYQVQGLLNVATAAVVAYAPRTFQAAYRDNPLLNIPERYALAQLRQAQNIWRASSAHADGTASEGEFVFTPRPLDWHVKQLIRPQHGRPTVG